VNIDIELITGGKMPEKAHPTDAGFDLFARLDEPLKIWPARTAIIPVGFVLGLPPWFEAQIRSKSGLALNGIVVANSPGTVDSGYRDEVKVTLHNQQNVEYDVPFIIEPGMKIAQMVIQEVLPVTLINTSVDKETDRGLGGFGSTGAF
jgi:dUTP pyrophosphatase